MLLYRPPYTGAVQEELNGKVVLRRSCVLGEDVKILGMSGHTIIIDLVLCIEFRIQRKITFQICDLLGYYAAYVDNNLPKFRDITSVLTSRVQKFKKKGLSS